MTSFSYNNYDVDMVSHLSNANGFLLNVDKSKSKLLFGLLDLVSPY